MDDNGILILIGIILQIITIIDKSILKRLKKSSCFGVNIELNNDNNNNNNNNTNKL